jgi:hypothetical protein
MKLYARYLAHSLANLQFPIWQVEPVETLTWEDGSTWLTTRFFLVEPRVYAVFGQAGPTGVRARGYGEVPRQGYPRVRGRGRL